MMKGWSWTQGDALRGFYLELMNVKVLANVTIADFPSGVRWVFDKGRDAVKYKMIDSAGFGDQVSDLRGVSVDQAVRLFQASSDLSLAAESWANYGYVRTAVDEWRKLFGDYFPAYG
jgi:hypothetical protein